MSRHYYDVYMLNQKDIVPTALERQELLQEIIQNNMVFFKDPNSAYDEAKLGKLRLVPSSEMLEVLEHDYKQREEMMIGKYPSFKEIIKVIKDLEGKLNN